MKNLTRFSLVFFLLCGTVYADKISSPPPLAESPTPLQHYLTEIYNNFHRLEIITTIPDGNKRGKKGDMVVFFDERDDKSQKYLMINIDSSTTWSGVVLQSIP